MLSGKSTTRKGREFLDQRTGRKRWTRLSETTSMIAAGQLHVAEPITTLFLLSQGNLP